KRAYCLKTQPATGETYPKSDLFNKADICLKYGFDSQQTFTRVFTRTFNQPPGAYRKENHSRAH
ncbi:AraC family transcriptional regulator, partial [Klebsiella pneumoniae]